MQNPKTNHPETTLEHHPSKVVGLKPNMGPGGNESETPATQNETSKRKHVPDAVNELKPRKRTKSSDTTVEVTKPSTGNSTNGKVATITQIGMPPPSDGAFAMFKLLDKDGTLAEVYLTTLPSTLGRPTKPNKKDSQFIAVGGTLNKSISRKHATIDFDPRNGEFFLVVLSKNGLVHNATFHKPGETSSRIYLQPGDKIRIGSTIMVFLPAQFPKPKESLVELVVAALSPTECHTSRAIAAQLLKKYPYYLAHYGNMTKFPDFESLVSRACAESGKATATAVNQQLAWLKRDDA